MAKGEGRLLEVKGNPAQKWKEIPIKIYRDIDPKLKKESLTIKSFKN